MNIIVNRMQRLLFANYFRVAQCILLVAVLGKVLSYTLGEEFFRNANKFFLFQPAFVFGTATIELLIVMLLQSQFSALLKYIVAYLLSWSFVAAHTFFHFAKIGGCPCLGDLAYFSEHAATVGSVLLMASVVYLWVGSTVGLLSEYFSVSQPSNEA